VRQQIMKSFFKFLFKVIKYGLIVALIYSVYMFVIVNFTGLLIKDKEFSLTTFSIVFLPVVVLILFFINKEVIINLREKNKNVKEIYQKGLKSFLYFVFVKVQIMFFARAFIGITVVALLMGITGNNLFSQKVFTNFTGDFFEAPIQVQVFYLYLVGLVFWLPGQIIIRFATSKESRKDVVNAFQPIKESFQGGVEGYVGLKKELKGAFDKEPIQSKKKRVHSETKKIAVAGLVLSKSYKVQELADRLDLNPSLIRQWAKKYEYKARLAYSSKENQKTLLQEIELENEKIRNGKGNN